MTEAAAPGAEQPISDALAESLKDIGIPPKPIALILTSVFPSFVVCISNCLRLNEQ